MLVRIIMILIQMNVDNGKNIKKKLTLLDQTEDHIVFFLRLDGHQIHAIFSADVPAIQPIHLLIC